MDETTITLRSYFNGYILALILTFAAYLAVVNGAPHPIVIIVSLAVIQLVVQLVYFLHISLRSKSRMQTSILVFALIGIGILLSGSLWIMYHLNYNMSPSEMTSIIMQEEGFQMK